jgi:hypothetical protein
VILIWSNMFHISPSVIMLLLLLLVGARGRRPLWSPPWVAVTFGHCFLFFLSFYSLFFTALPCPALPRPYLALPLPCLALPLPLPCLVSNFPFGARDKRRKLHREWAVFFFPFAARDRKRKLHKEWVLKARPYIHVVGSVWAHAKTA